MKAQTLEEALKFSQVRPFLKKWDKNRFREIFEKLPYKGDRNLYRLFIPLKTQTTTEINIPQEIQQFLNNNNYEMLDYIRGIIQHREKKQPIKIGKVLSKAGEKNILNIFNTDPQRESKKTDYMIVLSRHPYDIAGMSSDRGWTSCMNLNSGTHNKHIPIDIKSGTIIAYVTKTSDKNLNNPTGRILIKPFIDKLGSDKIFFVPVSKCYGTDVTGFSETVEKITDQINAQLPEDLAIFVWDDRVYDDSNMSSKTFMTASPEQKNIIKKINDDPEIVLQLKNPSEKIILFAISKDPTLIQHYDNPTIKMQKTAVFSNPDTLRMIKVPEGRLNEENVDIEVLKLALKNKPSLINYIETPSNDLLEFIIDDDLANIKLVKHKLDSKTLNHYKSIIVDFFIKENNFSLEESTDRIILDKFTDLSNLAANYGLKTLEYYAKIIDDGYMDVGDIYIDYNTTELKSDLERNNPEIIEKLREIVFKDQLDNGTIDQEEHDEKDLNDIIEEDTTGNLDSIFVRAVHIGVETGTYDEIYDAVQRWINDNSFVEEIKDGEFKVSITADTLFNEVIYNIDSDADYDQFEFENIFPDFAKDYLTDLDEPQYGFDGWSDSAAQEFLIEELNQFISDNLEESINIKRLKQLSGIK